MIEFKVLDEKYVETQHQERRAPINSEMKTLAENGKNCFNCEGFCCTFSYNSMQVTPLEALDAYSYLRKKNRIDEELIDCLRKCIKSFRLDVEISVGRMGELRRNYTCPFFNSGPKGCGISREYKPYGCLGFNPLEENVSTEGKCTSNIAILEKRESICDEKVLNEELREKLSLYWDKKNFPMALLSLIEKLGY